MIKNIPYKGAWQNAEFMKDYIEKLVKEIGHENFNETYLISNGHNDLMCALRRNKMKIFELFWQ